jgi:hypothetical protein
MKRSLTLIFIFIILLIGAFLLTLSKRESKSHSQVIQSPVMDDCVARQPQAKDELDKDSFLKQIKRNDERKVEKEAVQIRDDLLKAAQNKDSKLFGKRLSDLLYEFKVDPRPLLRELIPLLTHEDDYIGMMLSSRLLEARIATDQATACLLKIMARPGPLIEPKTEDDYLDIRLGIASILSEYPSEEISDAVWKLYERTKDKRLFDELLRLKNPNLPAETIPLLNEHGKVFDYIGIISEYKIKEAREPLLKWYANEYFMREGDGSKRGATLWGLWRLTGDQKYHDEFIAAGGGRSVAHFANEGTSEAKDHLVSMLSEARADLAQRLVMALHLKYGSPPELKEYLRNIYLKKGVPPIPLEMLYNLTSSFEDPEINMLAEESFSGSEGLGMWQQHGVYRKGWAIPEWAGGAFDIR